MAAHVVSTGAVEGEGVTHRHSQADAQQWKKYFHAGQLLDGDAFLQITSQPVFPNTSQVIELSVNPEAAKWNFYQ